MTSLFSPSVLFSISEKLASGIKHNVYICQIGDLEERYEWVPLTIGILKLYEQQKISITKIKKDILETLSDSELTHNDINLSNKLNSTLAELKAKGIKDKEIPNHNGRIYQLDVYMGHDDLFDDYDMNIEL